MQNSVVIAEIADNLTWKKFIAFYAHVWGVNTINDYTGIIDPLLEPENIGLVSESAVLSVMVEKKNYLKVDTVAEVINFESTFYFNDVTKLLLIHFENNKNPFDYVTGAIEISFTFGLVKYGAEVIPEWQEQQYFSRLLKFPSIAKRKDDLFFLRQIFSSGKISFDNSDYKFINFAVGKGVKSKNGALARILSWVGDAAEQPNYEDFEILYQGVISEISEGAKIDINLNDLRTTLNEKLPVNVLDTSNFPYIAEPDNQIFKPQIWGKCMSVPCVCLNEDENEGNTTGPWANYTFMVADNTLRGFSDNTDLDARVKLMEPYPITRLYIEDVGVGYIPTIFDDLENGIYTFTLSYNLFATLDEGGNISGFRNQDRVSVDVQGYNKENGTVEVNNALEILREIIFRSYGYSYASTFYNIATWQGFEDEAYDIGLYLFDPEEIKNIIEEIAASVLGEFIWQNDRKFSFSNDDYTGIAASINKNEFIGRNYILEVDSDTSQVLSSFRVGVRKKWSRGESDNLEWKIDNSNESDALVLYNSKKQKDFETLLINDSDAEKYAERIHFFGDVPSDIIIVTVPWKYRNLDKGDFIIIEYDLENKVFLGKCNCQILEISLNTNDLNVKLKLRIYKYNIEFGLVDELGQFLTDSRGNIETTLDLTL